MKNKTNLTGTCGQWKSFDGLCDRISTLCGSVSNFSFSCVLFAMAENSNADSGFQRMTCSTPTNPLKPGNPFIPATDSSLDLSVNFESARRQIHSANPFASENQLDNSSADLFTPRRKFTKPVKNP